MKHAVAIAEGGRTGEVRFLGGIENTPARIERIIKKLASRYNRLHLCFEAGPTGYGPEEGFGIGIGLAAVTRSQPAEIIALIVHMPIGCDRPRTAVGRRHTCL